MKKLFVTGLVFLVGCTSVEEKAQHNQAQIDIVRVQRDAQRSEKLADAEAKKALYEALAAVAQANPDQAGAVTVALAVQGLGGSDEKPNTPIVQLQARQQSEALQWAQALAPVAGGVVSTLGTAIVSGNVQRRQIEATRDVQINQANQTANAIASVADLGTAAVANVGDSYGGDYYSLTGSTIDNSTTATTTTTSTTKNTTTNTETNTTTSTTSSIADSYNTSSTSSVVDSYNTTDNSDNSAVDNSATSYDYSTSSSTTNNDNRVEYVTYEGTQFTLAGLLEYLQGTGQPYSIAIGDDVYSSDEEGGSGVTCVPDFSPGGWLCTGG